MWVAPINFSFDFNQSFLTDAPDIELQEAEVILFFYVENRA